MSTETTQTTTIPGAGQNERNMMRLFSELATGGAGQLGDLTALAGGDLSALGPSGQDQELVAASIQRAAEMARRALKSQLAVGGAALDEELAARGIQDSSIEGFRRAGLEAGAFDVIANMVDQSRQEGGQALMNLPFQRAAVQLNANQALFNRILGAGGTVAQQGLQERLAQPRGTTRTPFSSQLMGLGTQIGGILSAPFSRGSSRLFTGAGAAPTSTSTQPLLLPGFQAGIRQGGQ